MLATVILDESWCRLKPVLYAVGHFLAALSIFCQKSSDATDGGLF